MIAERGKRGGDNEGCRESERERERETVVFALEARLLCWWHPPLASD